MMFVPNAIYRVVGFNPDGTVTLRNIKTGEEITRPVHVDLNNGRLRVGDGRDIDGPVYD